MAALANRYVPIYVDVDEDRSTPQAFKDLRGIPDLRLISPDGRQIGHVVGYQTPAELEAFLEQGLQ